VLENGEEPREEGSEAEPSEERSAAESTSGARQGATPVASSAAPDLSVVSWSDVSEAGEDVHIFGTLRNNSSRPADRLRLRVRLLDEVEEELASRPARLVRNRVDGGGTVNFQVYFDRFLPYSEVDFVIEGRQ
jgi:hypothetical protein